MKRNLWAFSILLVLALVVSACGGNSNKVTTGAQDMKKVLAELKKAVDAGDSVKAKAEASELEEAWEKFEDDVKDKSKEIYDKVESPLHIVEAGVKSEPLDQATINAAIKDLDNALSEVEKL